VDEIVAHPELGYTSRSEFIKEQDGLKFRVYLKRFARYFGITELMLKRYFLQTKRNEVSIRTPHQNIQDTRGSSKIRKKSFLCKLQESKNLITSK
jgi:hypothetical protein